MCVEAGRDEQQFRREPRDRGLHSSLERLQPLGIAAPGAQRHVDRRRATFPRGTGAGVDAGLVQGRVQDRIVTVEDVLRPVAVVDVEVHDRELPDAVLLLHVACGDGDVVHEAEAHCPGGRRVMPRRANERKRPSLGGVDRAPGREQRRLPARRGRDRVRIVEPRRLGEVLESP